VVKQDNLHCVSPNTLSSVKGVKSRRRDVKPGVVIHGRKSCVLVEEIVEDKCPAPSVSAELRSSTRTRA
jgi:hypothetical protein